MSRVSCPAAALQRQHQQSYERKFSTRCLSIRKPQHPPDRSPAARILPMVSGCRKSSRCCAPQRCTSPLASGEIHEQVYCVARRGREPGWLRHCTSLSTGAALQRGLRLFLLRTWVRDLQHYGQLRCLGWLVRLSLVRVSLARRVAWRMAWRPRRMARWAYRRTWRRGRIWWRRAWWPLGRSPRKPARLPRL